MLAAAFFVSSLVQHRKLADGLPLRFLGGSLIYYFNEKHILKLFPLSSCQYVGTIPEKKTAGYRPFRNGHFVRVCTEKMMNHQYKGIGAINIYSNYNQIRAYVECSPDQSKNYTLSTFPSSNGRNFEDSGEVLTAVSVPEFHQSITVQLYQPTLIRWLTLLYVYK